ncbi:MAG: VPDSG-CTERM sorting domain-containing protein, partial [Bryobacteraceae bacterium]
GVWMYNVDLTSGQLQAGDTFVIYDFGGYVAGSIMAAPGWTASTSLLDGGPAGFIDITGDNPAEFNLIFTYNGPTITQTIGAMTFTGFKATTTRTGTAIDGWASRDHEIDGNVGTLHTDKILVPNAVPDGGTTVALLGLALIGAGALRRKLRTA